MTEEWDFPIPNGLMLLFVRFSPLFHEQQITSSAEAMQESNLGLDFCSHL